MASGLPPRAVHDLTGINPGYVNTYAIRDIQYAGMYRFTTAGNALREGEEKTRRCKQVYLEFYPGLKEQYRLLHEQYGRKTSNSKKKDPRKWDTMIKLYETGGKSFERKKMERTIPHQSPAVEPVEET